MAKKIDTAGADAQPEKSDHERIIELEEALRDLAEKFEFHEHTRTGQVQLCDKHHAPPAPQVSEGKEGDQPAS